MVSRPMKTGDIVVLRADPLRNGYGRLEGILPDGRVTVKWETDNVRPVHPQELELAEIWERRTQGTVTEELLDRLTRSD